jgi:hypothetical protein
LEARGERVIHGRAETWDARGDHFVRHARQQSFGTRGERRVHHVRGESLEERGDRVMKEDIEADRVRRMSRRDLRPNWFMGGGRLRNESRHQRDRTGRPLV